MRKNSFDSSKGTILDRILQEWRSFCVSRYIPTNSIVCDLGCGYDGRFIQNLSKKITRGIGIDIKVKATVIDQKIELRKADLNMTLPLENELADVVVSLAVIEHLDNYQGYICESYRILKSGGMILITTPDPKGESILKILGKLHLIDNDEIDDHKRYFSGEIMKKILSCSGFREVRQERLQFGFNNLFIAKK